MSIFGQLQSKYMEKSFGEKLKQLRESNKMTLKELSTELGIDTSMLGKIERGTRQANSEIIKKLSDLFNLDESELNVSMISDQIATKVVKKYDEHAQEILKVAERKAAYQVSKLKSKSKK